jgi:uncharacterized membrane protein YhaH (DUF805 family)
MRHLLPFNIGVSSAPRLMFRGASVFHYLFSFGGRINRAKMWLFFVVAAIWINGCFAILHFVWHPAPLVLSNGVTLRWAGLALIAPLFYSYLAVFVKRMHDRNRPWWWFIVFWLVPISLMVPTSFFLWRGAMFEQMPLWASLCVLVANILIFWSFVELFCLRGTVGVNRFGPDPLAHTA